MIAMEMMTDLVMVTEFVIIVMTDLVMVTEFVIIVMILTKMVMEMMMDLVTQSVSDDVTKRMSVMILMRLDERMSVMMLMIESMTEFVIFVMMVL